MSAEGLSAELSGRICAKMKLFFNFSIEVYLHFCTTLGQVLGIDIGSGRMACIFQKLILVLLESQVRYFGT